MREIKFRGKTKVLNKWVVGSLIIDKERTWISVQQEHWNMGTFDNIEVVPESVGQYTGLKDINGVEIFEGYILQTDYYPCSVEDDYVLVVEYDIDRFWCVRKLKANANARGVSDGIADGLYEFLDHGLKVIGNIYENPELLEVKENE